MNLFDKLFISLFIVLIFSVHEVHARTWQYNGKTIEGEFQRKTDDVVVVKKDTGGIVLIPEYQLSRADREYVRMVNKPGYRPPPTPQPTQRSVSTPQPTQRQTQSSASQGSKRSTTPEDIWGENTPATPTQRRAPARTASPQPSSRTASTPSQPALSSPNATDSEKDGSSAWSTESLKKRLDIRNMSDGKKWAFFSSIIFAALFGFPLLCFLQARFLFGQSDVTFSRSTTALILGYLAHFGIQLVGGFLAGAAQSPAISLVFALFGLVAGISIYASKLSINFLIAVLIFVISWVCVVGCIFLLFIFCQAS